MTTTTSRTCSRCLCDTTIASIRFDTDGICNFCASHDVLMEYYSRNRDQRLRELITDIKYAGKGKKYDCVVGVSGGTDSIYTLYVAKQHGLRPLAIHFDNGWNKEMAVRNIKKACDKLGVDLFTYVVNWDEFKDLQLAFLKASVPDIEVPTDIAIHGTLYRMARRYRIRYILGGQCFSAEGTVPTEWSFIDGDYIKDVHRLFGTVKLKTYPLTTVWRIAYDTFVRKIRQVPILNYMPYTKEHARAILEKELEWEYYGGHHYENTYSHFAFGYYSLEKFGIDKRKISLSGPIRSGVMSKAQGLAQLNHKPSISVDEISYCIKKLGLTQSQFEDILRRPNKTFHDYKTSYPWLQKLKPIIALAAHWKFISPVVYEKFTQH